jgi:hypothetical protein
MADRPDDVGDAGSRDENRRYREKFARGASGPEDAYLRRWIPRPSRTMTRWDFFMMCLGALLLVILIVVVVAAQIWPLPSAH